MRSRRSGARKARASKATFDVETRQYPSRKESVSESISAAAPSNAQRPFEAQCLPSNAANRHPKEIWFELCQILLVLPEQVIFLLGQQLQTKAEHFEQSDFPHALICVDLPSDSSLQNYQL